MATDVFGDSSLFEEFEKERHPSSSYIKKDLKTQNNGDKNKHIIFSVNDFESDSEHSPDADSEDDELQQQHNTESGITNLQSEPTPSKKGSPNIHSTDTISSQKNENDEDRTFKKFLKSDKDRFQTLNQDLDKLKRFSKLLDTTRHVDSEDGPAVQIIYQNNAIARKYRGHIEQYVSNLIENEKREQTGEKLTELRLKANTLSTVDLNPNLCKEDDMNMDCWSSHAIIGCSQMYEDFVLDTLGWPLVELTPTLTDGWEVPTYEQVFLSAMPCDENHDTCPAPQRKKKAKAACFNCGEGHMLAECPEPKDQARIRQRRREFMEQNQSPGSLSRGLSSQDHHNIEDDPRFASFKPGTVSDELREALGLEDNQIPSYIYQMRLLGYPPGWKQDAQDQKSGIALFDKHGKEVSESGESLEDGEMNPGYKPRMLDPSKIIEYEGFTVPLSEGKTDECQYFNLPPLQPHQMKTTVEYMHNQHQGYKKAMKRPRPDSTDEDNMDLDSDYAATPAKRLSESLMSPPPLPLNTPPCNPPLPDGTPPPTPPVTQGRALSFDNGLKTGQRSVDRSNSAAPSDSLEDLESQYKVLMQQLAAEDGNESEVVVIDEYESSKEREEGEISQDESQCSESTQIIEMETESPSTSTVMENSSTPIIIVKPSVSLSKDYGTPILEKTAISNLPDPSKFGTGIEDHIPYENLPDATGTFEKLKGVLGKIRDKFSGNRKKKSTS